MTQRVGYELPFMSGPRGQEPAADLTITPSRSSSAGWTLYRSNHARATSERLIAATSRRTPSRCCAGCVVYLVPRRPVRCSRCSSRGLVDPGPAQPRPAHDGLRFRGRLDTTWREADHRRAAAYDRLRAVSRPRVERLECPTSRSTDRNDSFSMEAAAAGPSHRPPRASEMDEQEQSGLPLPRCMAGDSDRAAAAFDEGSTPPCPDSRPSSRRSR
jgi:hypothetical protein